MRNKTFFIVSMVLIGAMLLTGCGTTALAQSETPVQRTLSVFGNGKAYLTPDLATIYIGVHTEGKDASEAVTSNNSQTGKVAEALKSAGIAVIDIQTTNFSIYPQQQYDPSGQITGITYVVDNTVYVIVRDISKIGDILNAVVKAGANSINSIQFDVADKSAALAEARKAAVADAQEQAKQLAGAAGVNLGEVQNIAVSSGGIPGPIFDGRGGGMAAEAAVPVTPGQMVVTVEVNLVYAIK